jgi:MFS family permease
MGWWSMTGAGAPTTSPIIGGPLVDWVGWRIVFAMQAVFAFVAFASAWWILRETPRRAVRLDWAGAVTLALGVGGFMFALAEVREHGVASPWVLGPCVLGAIGLAVFWQIERLVTAPLLPPALLRKRAFTAPVLANAFTSASYMGAFAVAPYLLGKVFGLTTALTAFVLLLRTASFTFSSPVGGALGERLGERAAARIGCAVMVVSMGVLSAGAWTSSFVVVAIGLVLQGISYGLCTPSITSAASNAASEDDLGISSAVSRLMGSVGSAFGVTLLTLLYGGVVSPAAFTTAFGAGGLLAALAWIATLAMKREPIATPRGGELANGLRSDGAGGA